MNILHTCPPYLSDVATLLWEIQKGHFSTVLFTHTHARTHARTHTHTSDYLCYLRRKQIATVLLQLSCLLYVANTASGALYRRSACIDYLSAIGTSCGSGLLRHGLNFSSAWCTTVRCD